MENSHSFDFMFTNEHESINRKKILPFTRIYWRSFSLCDKKCKLTTAMAVFHLGYPLKSLARGNVFFFFLNSKPRTSSEVQCSLYAMGKLLVLSSKESLNCIVPSFLEALDFVMKITCSKKLYHIIVNV